ncbi:BTB/POZ domain-containing protein 6-B-like isoform X2 [Venturia canescens]|uniref:BTB/POZ domain-containing protein 6-B-like isoform X2 n=1 Tax=Venturia canescens TaxID=32260 RepID=UPI001C9BF30A|nr:BTB/POZ domain-containing protein 6-B-like isoform X2 [Venturia canescens]
MNEENTGPKKMSNSEEKKRTLLERGRELLESNRLSDCQFLVGPPPNQEIVEAHKVFLAMSSPVFEKMFYGYMLEDSKPIQIPEVTTEGFKALLRFIYIDELVLDRFEVVQDLYFCAQKYMLPELAAQCKVYIQSNLSAERVCKIYEFSQFFEESELEEQCLKLMQTETKKILLDKNWEEAQMTTVSVLFQQNQLAIDSEIQLYDGLLAWARAKCQRKGFSDDQNSLRSVVGDLITKIRFLTLTPAQFADGPGKGEILTNDEILALIMKISSSRSIRPIPEGFSEDKNHRARVNGAVQPTLVIPKREMSPNRDLPRAAKRSAMEPYYCCRNFVSEFDYLNVDYFQCSLSFRVDTKLKIRGFTLSSLKSRRDGEPIGYQQKTSFAYLNDSKGNKLTQRCFVFDVRRQCPINVAFEECIEIERNEDYTIGVVFNQLGTYSAIKGCAPRVTSHQVKFTFMVGPNGQNVRNGLIRGIFFSK